MPSKSKAQEKLMRAVAHNPKIASKHHIPQSVAKEFVTADKATGKSKLPKRRSKVEKRYGK